MPMPAERYMLRRGRPLKIRKLSEDEARDVFAAPREARASRPTETQRPLRILVGSHLSLDYERRY
jgi:hypothetical protein